MTDVNELLYIPFLKLKQNEIMALKELYSPIKDLVIPFLTTRQIRMIHNLSPLKKKFLNKL